MRYLFSTILILFFITFVACEDEPEPLEPVGELSIIETILSDSNTYGNLEKLLTKAGLVNRLEAGGTYTLLAPTPATLDAFLDGKSIDEVDGGDLKEIFSYHVLPGLLAESSFEDKTYTPSINNSGPNDLPLSVYSEISGGNTLFNGAASIVQKSAELSNGIIYQIDNVLTPPSLQELVDFDSRFSSFKSLITSIGEEGDLSLNGGHTLLASNESAFNQFLTENNLGSINDLTSDAAVDLVEYHFLMDTILLSEELENGLIGNELLDRNILVEVDTIGFNPYFVSHKGDTAHFETPLGAIARNGIAYLIDGVLRPN